MNKQRVLQLLDSYGARPEFWPADERAAAIELISNSGDLLDAQQSASELDTYLDLDRQYSDISQHQANALAQKTIDLIKPETKTNSSFFKDISRYLMLPRYAVAFTALLSVFVVMSLINFPRSNIHYVQSDFDDWMLTQVTGEIVEQDNPSNFGFMELVELESDEDSTI